MKKVVWVAPKVLCRVSFGKRGKQGGLYETELETMLSEVDLNGLR